jgi:hypothetical protein
MLDHASTLPNLLGLTAVTILSPEIILARTLVPELQMALDLVALAVDINEVAASSTHTYAV